MDKLTLKRAVQRLVGEAETEQALDMMLSFFAKEPAYLNLYNKTLQAKALFNRTEKDENQGVIAADAAKINYNQVTRQILDILQTLDKEDKISYKATGPSNQRMQRNILIGIALLAILGVIGIMLYRTDAFGSNGLPNIEPIPPGQVCPDFPLDSNLNVLVLPFKDLNGNTETGLNTRVAKLIELRLDDFKSQYGVNFDLAVKTDLLLEDFPTQISDAETIAEACDAELIIWGTSEKTPDDDEIIITRYKFLNAERLSLHKLVLTTDTDIDTITTQSSIVTNGQLTESIEETLQYIFGIIAHESGNAQAVIAAYRNLILEGDSTAAFTREVLLTDAYILADSSLMALKQTERINKMHPEYFWAQNNKGIMAFRQKEYDESYQRLAVAEQLSKSPNSDILEGKSIALTHANNPDNFPMGERMIMPPSLTDSGLEKKDLTRKSIEAEEPEKTVPDGDNWRKLLQSEEGLIKLIKSNPRNVYLWKRITTLYQTDPNKDFDSSFEELAKLAASLDVADCFYQTPLGEWWKLKRAENI